MSRAEGACPNTEGWCMATPRLPHVARPRLARHMESNLLLNSVHCPATRISPENVSLAACLTNMNGKSPYSRRKMRLTSSSEGFAAKVLAVRNSVCKSSLEIVLRQRYSDRLQEQLQLRLVVLDHGETRWCSRQTQRTQRACRP